jgi:DNA polymerase III epsilon subunit-like protein
MTTIYGGHPHKCAKSLFLKLGGLLFSSRGLQMSWIMVDIEADGPIPGEYSMVCFGAVVVERVLSRTFYGKLRPISEKYVPQALAVSGFTREETFTFDDPRRVMDDFSQWIQTNSKGRHQFVSDNNGFDWMFICWYFHQFLGANPFGHSSTNLGSLYKGLVRDTFKNFKHLRRTAHTHHPVDDARGNAEAFLRMIEEHRMRISI